MSSFAESKLMDTLTYLDNSNGYIIIVCQQHANGLKVKKRNGWKVEIISKKKAWLIDDGCHSRATSHG